MGTAPLARTRAPLWPSHWLPEDVAWPACPAVSGYGCIRTLLQQLIKEVAPPKHHISGTEALQRALLGNGHHRTSGITPNGVYVDGKVPLMCPNSYFAATVKLMSLLQKSTPIATLKSAQCRRSEPVKSMTGRLSF